MKNKLKTHKSTIKRFKLTKKNKLFHNKQGNNTHLKANKNRMQKARKKNKKNLSSTSEKNKILKLMNY